MGAARVRRVERRDVAVVAHEQRRAVVVVGAEVAMQHPALDAARAVIEARDDEVAVAIDPADVRAAMTAAVGHGAGGVFEGRGAPGREPTVGLPQGPA